jgi:ribosomal protein S27E
MRTNNGIAQTKIFINNKINKSNMIKNIHQVKECPECGSKNIRYDEEKNQVICEDCGLIYEPMAPKVEKKFEKASKQK